MLPLRTNLRQYVNIRPTRILRGIDPPTNQLLETITSHIAARKELAGAYLTIDQSVDSGYACKNEEILFSLLLMVDDLTRGAGKRVVANISW